MFCHHQQNGGDGLVRSVSLRPSPRAVVAIGEEEVEVEADAGFGDRLAPPGAAEGVGDGVMHEAAAFWQRLEAMFMHKLSEWAFEHLIDQHSRRLHGLPAALPAHGNDPPVAAVKLDQAAFLGRAVGLQAQELQRRRHDVDDVSRIAVKGEHLLRAGGESRGGMKGGGHGQACT